MIEPTPGPMGRDLLDFSDAQLYFDETPVAGTDALLQEAAAAYGQPEAEAALLRAYFLAPTQLSVLVALYRYYFYQHRLEDTLRVADRCLPLVAARLGLPSDWAQVTPAAVQALAPAQLPLLRFHLLALKGSVIVLLRLGKRDEARARLAVLIALDEQDQLDVRPLKTVIDDALAEEALAA